MSWNFHNLEARVGAESALDACDYFVDEVIEPWKILGEKLKLFCQFGWVLKSLKLLKF